MDVTLIFKVAQTRPFRGKAEIKDINLVSQQIIIIEKCLRAD